MNRVQYVGQLAVKEFDTAALTNTEQDEFIRQVAVHMERDMDARTKGAKPLSDAQFTVTGPHQDPIQGIIHVHMLACWFDLDTMAADAQFRMDLLGTATTENADQDLIQ